MFGELILPVIKLQKDGMQQYGVFVSLFVANLSLNILKQEQWSHSQENLKVILGFKKLVPLKQKLIGGKTVALSAGIRELLRSV